MDVALIVAAVWAALDLAIVVVLFRWSGRRHNGAGASLSAHPSSAPVRPAPGPLRPQARGADRDGGRVRVG